MKTILLTALGTVGVLLVIKLITDTGTVTQAVPAATPTSSGPTLEFGTGVIVNPNLPYSERVQITDFDQAIEAQAQATAELSGDVIPLRGGGA